MGEVVQAHRDSGQVEQSASGHTLIPTHGSGELLWVC